MTGPDLEPPDEQPPEPRGSSRRNGPDQNGQAYVEQPDSGEQSDETWSDASDDNDDQALHNKGSGRKRPSKLRSRFSRSGNGSTERPYFGNSSSAASGFGYQAGAVTVPYQPNPFSPSTNPGPFPPQPPPSLPYPGPPLPHPQHFVPYPSPYHGGMYPPHAAPYAPAFQPMNHFRPAPPHQGDFYAAQSTPRVRFQTDTRPGRRSSGQNSPQENHYRQKYLNQQERIRQLETEREEESARMAKLEHEKKQQAAKQRKIKARRELQKEAKSMVWAELNKLGLRGEATFPHYPSESATRGRQRSSLHDAVAYDSRNESEREQMLELAELFGSLLRTGRRSERHSDISANSSIHGQRKLEVDVIGSEMIPIHREVILDLLDSVDEITRRNLIRELLMDSNSSTASSVVEQRPRRIGQAEHIERDYGRRTSSTSHSTILGDRNSPSNVRHGAEIPHRPHTSRQNNALRSRGSHEIQSESRSSSFQGSGIQYPEDSQVGRRHFDSHQSERLPHREGTPHPSSANAGEASPMPPLEGLRGGGGINMRPGSHDAGGLDQEDYFSEEEDLDLPGYQNRSRPYMSVTHPNSRSQGYE